MTDTQTHTQTHTHTHTHTRSHTCTHTHILTLLEFCSSDYSASQVSITDSTAVAVSSPSDHSTAALDVSTTDNSSVLESIQMVPAVMESAEVIADMTLYCYIIYQYYSRTHKPRPHPTCPHTCTHTDSDINPSDTTTCGIIISTSNLPSAR
jgi:hypothetical protein